MFWLFGIFVLFVGIGNHFRVRANVESSLRAWAKANGYQVHSLEVIRHAATSRYHAIRGEAEVALSRLDQEIEVPGRLHWSAGILDIVSIEYFPSRAISNVERRSRTSEAELDEDRLATLYIEDDREAQILNEVNRRLDGITSQAHWMQPYDLDGSGHIDEEEWSILRGDILAAVRGELGDPGVRAVAVPDQNEEAEELNW